jgi:hypothetical protein
LELGPDHVETTAHRADPGGRCRLPETARSIRAVVSPIFAFIGQFVSARVDHPESAARRAQRFEGELGDLYRDAS